jgi:oligopeptide transport system substrate-binding protein
MKQSVRLFVVCVCLLLFVSCGDRKRLVDLGTEQQIMHISNATEPSGVDPHTTTGMPEYRLQMALFEGLVAKHPETLEIIPGVADSWQISDDGLVYTFHIREDAKWSNGEKLIANDFTQSWHRALMPGLANEYVESLFVLKNAEKFFKQELKNFSDVGVKALDDSTLRIELKNPTPYFLQLLDHHSMFPVHIDTISKFSPIDERDSTWTRPENFVGNGPFVIHEWTPGKVFSVTPNPYYWDAKMVKLKEIRFYPVEQLLAEERMFKAGQLHKTEWMPIAKIEKYKKANDPEYVTFPYLATYFYILNVTKPPTNDVRVRKALAYAVDRESIAKNITKGQQLPAYSLTPPDVLGYTAKAKMTYDLNMARKLLTEAGYPNGEGMPPIELIYNTSEDHQKIAQAVQQMWKKNLNINVTLQNQEWKVFLDNQKLLNYQVARMAWVGDYVDPNTFLEIFITNGGNNRTGWSNAKYDQMIRAATSAKNREERYELLQQAEQILVDEVPFIPIYNYSTNNLLSTDVKGYYMNIMDYHPYKYIHLESSKK